MATTSEGIISGAATGAATGSIAGPWGAVVGGVVGGVLGGFTTSAQNDAAKKQAYETYNNALDYATDNYQQQKFLIGKQNDELKQQSETKINNRALNTLQERGNLRNALISNNIGGNASKRLNAVSALTGATDIGIIEKNLSNNLFNQELKLKQAKNQYLDTIRTGEIKADDILETTRTDILGTVGNVAQGALGTYSGLKSFGTFDSKNNKNKYNFKGALGNKTIGRTNDFVLKNPNGENINNEASIVLGGEKNVNPFNTTTPGYNVLEIDNVTDLNKAQFFEYTNDFDNQTIGNTGYELKDNLYKPETFNSMQKDIVKMDNIIVKNNINSNIQLINFKENYTNKDTTGINKIERPKKKKAKVKTYNYNNSNNFLYIKK